MKINKTKVRMFYINCLWCLKGQKQKGIYACMQQNKGKRIANTRENIRQENIRWDMAFRKGLHLLS